MTIIHINSIIKMAKNNYTPKIRELVDVAVNEQRTINNMAQNNYALRQVTDALSKVKPHWKYVKESILIAADRAENGIIARWFLPEIRNYAPKIRDFVASVDKLMQVYDRIEGN